MTFGEAYALLGAENWGRRPGVTVALARELLHLAKDRDPTHYGNLSPNGLHREIERLTYYQMTVFDRPREIKIRLEHLAGLVRDSWKQAAARIIIEHVARNRLWEGDRLDAGVALIEAGRLDLL